MTVDVVAQVTDGVAELGCAATTGTIDGESLRATEAACILIDDRAILVGDLEATF